MTKTTSSEKDTGGIEPVRALAQFLLVSFSAMVEARGQLTNNNQL